MRLIFLFLVAIQELTSQPPWLWIYQMVLLPTHLTNHTFAASVVAILPFSLLLSDL